MNKLLDLWTVQIEFVLGIEGVLCFGEHGDHVVIAVKCFFFREAALRGWDFDFTHRRAGWDTVTSCARREGSDEGKCSVNPCSWKNSRA